jgi:hypothetical protein
MATQIKIRGGTTSQHGSFTGGAREITVDTDKNTVVVHDGSTAGGFPLAKASELFDGLYTGNVDITGELIATSYNETFAAVTSTSNAATVNCETGNVFSHTLTENTTFTFSNPPASGTAYGFTLKVVQDSTARTITWPASVDWAGGNAPEISGGSGDVDVFVFFTHDGGTTWYGFTAGQVLS